MKDQSINNQNAPESQVQEALDGVWNVIIHGPTGPQETVLTLETVNGVLTGTQSAMGQVEEATELTHNDTKGTLSWVNKIKKPLPITLRFAGEIEGKEISGKVNAGIMGSFPFTAIKS